MKIAKFYPKQVAKKLNGRRVDRILNNVGVTAMREYQAARDAGAIEPGIHFLRDALHKAGVDPLSSCEGHSFSVTGILGRLLSLGRPKVPFRPFVMFSAPERYARFFQEQYDLAGGFNYCWTIKGHFHPDSYELVWVIEPNDIRLAEGSVDLGCLGKDIVRLAAVAIQARARTKGMWAWPIEELVAKPEYWLMPSSDNQ